MADNITITQDLAGFAAYEAAILAALAHAVEAAAETTSGDAEERCPVKTGALKASIGYQMTGELEATVAATEDYAVFVDEGTSRQPANPFFTGAVEAERARFAERVAEALAEATRE